MISDLRSCIVLVNKPSLCRADLKRRGVKKNDTHNYKYKKKINENKSIARIEIRESLSNIYYKIRYCPCCGYFFNIILLIMEAEPAVVSGFGL